MHLSLVVFSDSTCCLEGEFTLDPAWSYLKDPSAAVYARDEWKKRNERKKMMLPTSRSTEVELPLF